MRYLISVFVGFSYLRLPVYSNFCKSTSSSLSYYFTDNSTCLQPPIGSCNIHQELEDLLNGKTAIESEKSERFKQKMNRELSGLYRPRSALARALYEKQRNDGELRRIDKTEWYKVDKSRLSSELQSKFVQLGPDRETREFIADSIEKSSWIWTQIWYLLAKLILRLFWSITDINGWLGRGSMFVLSSEQLTSLCGDAWSIARPRSLVDVGAGDGEVTRRWAGLFAERYATELSAKMRQLLAKKGYTILDADTWWSGSTKFSCVCMLNLLDRCSRPRTMLRQAREAMTRDGLLIVALVVPYRPYVEITKDHKPEERLPINGSVEEQAEGFVTYMRQEMRFELVRWSRVPYLCEGDVNQAYYWLDDTVFVFRRTD